MNTATKLSELLFESSCDDDDMIYENLVLTDDDLNEEQDVCPGCVAEQMAGYTGPLEEAEYQGRKVALNKPMQGDVKKFKVSHIVYSITNKLTEKAYIGYTKLPVEKRWQQHYKRAAKTKCNTPFYNAINKYGMHVWDLQILQTCSSASEAKMAEIILIEKYDSYKNGYNATLGGDGNNGLKMSEESNAKRSIALKGRPKNYNRMHGKKHSAATIEKMRKPKTKKAGYLTDAFKQRIKNIQLKQAAERRALTKEQYDCLHEYIADGNLNKKQIASLMNISYSLIKKWSNRDW